MGADEVGRRFEELVGIMARLRAPGGCPWDREQTPDTLKPFLIEEAYEVLEAVDSGDDTELKEELGDLLLQVVFHAELAAERGAFTIADVLAAIADKLVRRHPHVFGEARAETPTEVLHNWERLKQAERGGAGEASALHGVPATLPALLRAQRLQDKAARVGFDWGALTAVLSKVDEEVKELKEAVAGGDPVAIEAEVGDLFFALVNASRFLDVSAEEALRKAIGKFTRRFRHIESTIVRRGGRLEEAGLPEMDRLWEEAKAGERTGAE
ncbi:MAG: nucleoside triphosphate pyrophosphohydrolase [Candidatus Methylomirabilales bacterium]